MTVKDFTTFTEQDPQSEITVTSTRATFTQLDIDVQAWLYEDLGADAFDGDFSINVEFMMTGSPGGLYTISGSWALTNEVNDLNSIDTGNGDYLALRHRTTGQIVLVECKAGSLYTSSTFTPTQDVLYYLTIARDESVGTYGTLYCYVYSDADRTSLLDTLSLTLHAKLDFEYLFTVITYYLGSTGKWMDGYLQNMEITSGPTVPTAPSNSSPTDGAVGQSLTPTLQSSAYSGAGDQTAAQWQITTTPGDYGTPVYDSNEDDTNLVSIAVPSSTLSVGTVYYWHVRHKNAFGWSSYSTETSFTTKDNTLIEKAVDSLDTYLEANLAAKLNTLDIAYSDTITLDDVSNWVIGDIPSVDQLVNLPIIVIIPSAQHPDYEWSTTYVSSFELSVVVIVGEPDNNAKVRFQRLARYARAINELVKTWENAGGGYIVFFRDKQRFSGVLPVDPFIQAVEIPLQLIKKEVIL